MVPYTCRIVPESGPLLLVSGRGMLGLGTLYPYIVYKLTIIHTYNADEISTASSELPALCEILLNVLWCLGFNIRH